jgi:hypothetical protein
MTLSSKRAVVLLVLSALLCALGAYAQGADAAPLGDDGGAEWRLEQPAPPEPPSGVEGAKVPIGLGRIGDIEFYSPNRGVLTTAGNGSTVPPGVWEYNGVSWHELSTQCGASLGQRTSPPNPAGASSPISPGLIAWAGPDEFWTISDGRPGQAVESLGRTPSLEDNTLCRFALNSSGELEIIDSYASLAFQSTSYLAMNAAACLGSSDCWFGGEPLQSPQIGAFHLHWNGRTLASEPYLPEGHAVENMAAFEGHLYESVRLKQDDPILQKQGGVGEEPALHRINPEGVSPTFEPLLGLPLLGNNEFPTALDFLHLSSAGNALWAAAGPAREKPEGSSEAGVTVLRYSKEQYSDESHGYSEGGAPSWKQVLGPETEPSGKAALPEDVVSSVASEPESTSAWLALITENEAGEGPNPTARATVAHISADGSVSDQLQLPADEEGSSPKGAAERIVCPAVHDCWMTTTQGWLFHLSTQSEHEHPEPDNQLAFSGTYLITERPKDEGVPQQVSDALPVNDSGLEEEPPTQEALKVKPVAVVNPFASVTLPLLANVHSRLIHGTTLDLSFHLSVKAKVRLLAKRKSKTVASTPTRTLLAGNRSLLLRLNTHSWPTKLDLQTHALEPLKTASTRESGSNTDSVSTSLSFPNAHGALQSSQLGSSGLLP